MTLAISSTTDPLRCYSDAEIAWPNPQFPQCDLSTSINGHLPHPVMAISPTVQNVGCDFLIANGSTGPFEVVDVTGRSIAVLPMAHGQLRFALDRPGTYVVRSRSQALTPVRIAVP